MERRSFLKSSVSVCAASTFLSAGPLWADTHDSNEVSYTQRLTGSDLNSLHINPPSSLLENPQNTLVKVQLKPIVARRYSSNVYILFELSKHISVYDNLGEKISEIPFPNALGHIKDFAIDERHQRIFVASRNAYSIHVLDFSGQLINTFGNYGIELPHQVSGIKSITSDNRGFLHILNSYTNDVKVFDGQGVYQFSYRPKSLTKNTTLSSIDGYQTIRLSGGKFKDIVYTLNVDGKTIG
ncbi:hypothetical protein [Pseudoalteromonas luteoviolacea]|uniref:6-bladed beta-propeller n=1 Tax=Pseudoalteromonas luteoviolacea S4060-1 TaxID=1365257 RepID=A0A161YPG6_9GAMM|nr:hypothetical protein [Pseudoalteromonas luteoviolacea]KZN63867.1 hypothetical protein N478_23250 [Pseudoalteromonas luteoviolacea S4060-1]